MAGLVEWPFGEMTEFVPAGPKGIGCFIVGAPYLISNGIVKTSDSDFLVIATPFGGEVDGVQVCIDHCGGNCMPFHRHW